MFKLWSEIKKEAKEELRPDFGFRNWNDLKIDDKKKIWLYLWEKWFFDPSKNDFKAFHSYEKYTSDQDRDKKEKFKRIYTVLAFLNEKYKTKAYARNFLDNRSVHSALSDFYRIFSEESENVVFELLSLYAKMIILEGKDERPWKEDDKSENDFEKGTEKWRWEEFDKFTEDLNDVFEHFGIYVFLTRQGFAPRQSKEIIENVYNPVLEVLSSKEYKDVNLMLEKAFKNFREKHFDKVIENSINTIHAYLQLKIHKKIGKGNLKALLKEAQKQKIIPYGDLIVDLYGNIEGFFARTRKNKTDAHPSKDQATELDALFVLNLTMVILQSFVNFKK